MMVTTQELHQAAAILLQGIHEQPSPALTERELLHHVVDFANGKMPAGPLIAPGVRVLPPRPVQSGRPNIIDVVPTDELERQRMQLREDLAAAVGKGLPPQTVERLRKAALQMVDMTVAHEFERTRSRPRLRYLRARRYYLPMNLDAILAHSVLLLRDETLALGGDLKQCALPHCRRFFFSSETAKRLGEKSGKPRGRPRALFCSDEHMREAHQATGAARTRKWREGKK
jgi:hypothetical protein